MTEPNFTGDGRTMTVRVPISIRRRGGRKLVFAPDGTNVTTSPVRRHLHNAMVKAIARAFRWREMLENSTYATSAEIAADDKINESYVSRVPATDVAGVEIVEAIIAGRQQAHVRLAVSMRPFPVQWSAQEEVLLQSAISPSLLVAREQNQRWSRISNARPKRKNMLLKRGSFAVKASLPG
jgi:hypothetical protein